MKNKVQPVAPGQRKGASREPGASMSRHYLFLQGVASPFFPALADHLSATGARVSRIDFCAGDALYWGRRPSWRFRQDVAQLPGFLRDLFDRHGFTDLVLFGSQRPVHRPAIAQAQQSGVRVHVFEEGYVRPNWLTLERDGVNADSALPRDPAWYLAADAALRGHANGAPAHSDIRVRAAHDLAYHLANSLNPLLFRGYRTHRPHNALVEYAGWVRRFSRLPLYRRHDRRLIDELVGRDSRYFLLPLQLNGDTQITLNSRYGGMPHLIDTVMRAFAGDAPSDSLLVIKNHPLDTGLVDYRELIDRLQRELDIAGRVLYLESGHLPSLIRAALGVVTVNSTVGTIALAHGRPTIALGVAIYDLPGLTFQGHLRDFWDQAGLPDPKLFRAFRNTVIHTTQVNGDFYTARGMAMAVANCDRMLGEVSPLQELMQRIPTDQPAVGRAEVAR